MEILINFMSRTFRYVNRSVSEKHWSVFKRCGMKMGAFKPIWTLIIGTSHWHVILMAFISGIDNWMWFSFKSILTIQINVIFFDKWIKLNNAMPYERDKPSDDEIDNMATAQLWEPSGPSQKFHTCSSWSHTQVKLCEPYILWIFVGITSLGCRLCVQPKCCCGVLGIITRIWLVIFLATRSILQGISAFSFITFEI